RPVRRGGGGGAHEKHEHWDRGDRCRRGERKDPETPANGRRTGGDERQATTPRGGRQPSRGGSGGNTGDKGKSDPGAEQSSKRRGRLDKVDEEDRPVGREHRDRQREAEGRQAQQDQQRFELRGGLSSTRKVKLPALRMTLMTVRQALDECRCDVQPAQALAAAAAAPPSPRYLSTPPTTNYPLPPRA